MKKNNLLDTLQIQVEIVLKNCNILHKTVTDNWLYSLVTDCCSPSDLSDTSDTDTF